MYPCVLLLHESCDREGEVTTLKHLLACDKPARHTLRGYLIMSPHKYHIEIIPLPNTTCNTIGDVVREFHIWYCTLCIDNGIEPKCITHILLAYFKQNGY